MLEMAHPLICRPPYALSWLSTNISAPQMMEPEVIEKLVLNSLCKLSDWMTFSHTYQQILYSMWQYNFLVEKKTGPVPAKLLYQLATSVDKGGLRDRTSSFYYKDHISTTNVPILALAGDWDIVCPPDAVYGSYSTAYLNREYMIFFNLLIDLIISVDLMSRDCKADPRTSSYLQSFWFTWRSTLWPPGYDLWSNGMYWSIPLLNNLYWFLVFWLYSLFL